MRRQLRKAAVSAAVALFCGGAMVLGAGAAQATPATYVFSNTTLNQSFSGTACPSWVSFAGYCLAVTVDGSAVGGQPIHFSGVVALATGDGDNRAERRGTITTPTGPVAFAATGTYDKSDGSASYKVTQVNSSTFYSLAITVAPPSTYDPATGSGTGTETWKGKIGTS